MYSSPSSLKHIYRKVSRGNIHWFGTSVNMVI
uniref:Uncharacterized protein n=1 Tax=Anguilla anguilla TaxID=7936 RepID=A0A0E9QZI8_ANGAN